MNNRAIFILLFLASLHDASGNHLVQYLRPIKNTVDNIGYFAISYFKKSWEQGGSPSQSKELTPRQESLALSVENKYLYPLLAGIAIGTGLSALVGAKFVTMAGIVLFTRAMVMKLLKTFAILQHITTNTEVYFLVVGFLWFVVLSTIVVLSSPILIPLSIYYHRREKVKKL